MSPFLLKIHPWTFSRFRSFSSEHSHRRSCWTCAARSKASSTWTSKIACDALHTRRADEGEVHRKTYRSPAIDPKTCSYFLQLERLGNMICNMCNIYPWWHSWPSSPQAHQGINRGRWSSRQGDSRQWTSELGDAQKAEVRWGVEVTPLTFPDQGIH